MSIVLDPTWHMWFVIAVLAVTMVSFALERVSIEMTSLSMLAVLLLASSLASAVSSTVWCWMADSHSSPSKSPCSTV